MISLRRRGLKRRYEGDFLPNLCTVQAVFALILVGELLAFAFVVIDHGLLPFNWLYFGTISFLVQWVILASAALLCPLRPWLKLQRGEVAGMVSYGVVLLVTGLVSFLGQWFGEGRFFVDKNVIYENLIIAAIFAGVVLRYFYLQQQLQNREKIELRSRIQALQSRIRPHFLFNSMNSIVSLIDIDPKAAEKMVVDLAQLFRASLSEETMVSLEKELALCQQFVSIEQTRLGARLQVDWQLELNEQFTLVPSLLLQPLIENAIYHGVQSLPDGGVVTVAARIEKGQVHLQVRNPVGEQRDKLDASNNGMALENISHRLQAHFAERAFLACRREGSEFTVDIRYPVIQQIENEG